MPDGFKSGKFGDLVDMTYDGIRDKNRYLFGGLGQLVDGIKGDDNYKFNEGFEWIGWKSDGEPNDQIQIIFEFDENKNFTSASFYCHNLFKQEMEVFSSAKIWFSFDGKIWSKRPVEFSYMADNVIDRARDVVIHLHHRVGKFVKFDLKFAKKWILISEVSFEVSSVEDNYTEPYHDILEEIESLSLKEFIFLVVFALAITIIFIASIVILRLHMRRKEKSGHIVVCAKVWDALPFVPFVLWLNSKIIWRIWRRVCISNLLTLTLGFGDNSDILRAKGYHFFAVFIGQRPGLRCTWCGTD